MKKMHIIHIITTISPGGAENQLLLLCQELIKLETEQTIIYLKGSGELKPKFEILGVPCFNAIRLSELFVFFKRFHLAKTQGLVLFHAHLPRAEILGLVLSAFTRTKLLVTKHNMEKFWPNGPYAASKIMAMLVEMRSNRVICISKSVSNYLMENGEVLNPDKYEVVHYGRVIKSAGEKTRLQIYKQAAQRNPRTIISVSRLEDQKDLPTQFRAIEILKTKYPDISLVVVGEGSKRTKLQQLIEELNLEKQVRLLGKVENVHAQLSHGAIFVLSSRYEGFGLAILEAIDAEIPILVADSKAALEVLGYKRELVFPVGNFAQLASKIDCLLSSQKARSMNLYLSNEATTKFDIARTAERHVEVYRKVFLK
jgi:glycosyltransferase involved in cell wall biosynthesis